jgi:molybdate transport system substrate-binding protein
MDVLRRGVVLLAVLVAVGCSGSSDTGSSNDDVTVYAAASMSGAMADIAEAFEEATGGNVTLNIAGSNVLATQLREGGKADVFISADESVMSQLRQETDDLVGSAVIIASNPIVLAVPMANPGDIGSVDDITRPQAGGRNLIIAVCEEAVPCGAAADRVLADLGTPVGTVTREADVRAVTAKLTLNEVDAGFVYRSDLIASGGDLTEIELPPTAGRESNLYTAAVVGDASVAGQAFVDHLRSPSSQDILAAHGFGPADRATP